VTPLFYGILIFVNLAILLNKITNGKYLSFMIDVGVFWLVLSAHGHSMTGGFAAIVASTLSGIFFPLMIRRAFR